MQQPAAALTPPDEETAWKTRAPDAELERTRKTVDSLGPWTQNIHLPSGIETAPDHPLGDWPATLWTSFADEFSMGLRGKTVLDIGCNAGFFCFELAARGAAVMGIDPDPRHIRQARWLRKKLRFHSRVRFRHVQVYDLARYARDFDYVLMLGVFDHLRYPLLGLDIAAEKARELFIFQTLTTPPGTGISETLSRDGNAPVEDLQDLSPLTHPSWPQVTFVEETLLGDPSHWWIPNPRAVPALLRSAGLEVLRRRSGHVFVCRPEPDRSAVQTWDRPEYLAATGRSWRTEPPHGSRTRRGTPDAKRPRVRAT